MLKSWKNNLLKSNQKWLDCMSLLSIKSLLNEFLIIIPEHSNKMLKREGWHQEAILSCSIGANFDNESRIIESLQCNAKYTVYFCNLYTYKQKPHCSEAWTFANESYQNAYLKLMRKPKECQFYPLSGNYYF